ncbi:MAG: HD-GYP domain-containing protein, partial [Bacillota bacterium]
ISEQTRMETVKLTREVFSNVKINAKVNVQKVNQMVDRIIEEIMSRQNFVQCLVDIRALNNYTFAHSVNVAVLSLITGVGLGFAHEKLKQLAIGALFHDIGKIGLPEDLLAKEESLTEVEAAEVQKHAEAGFEILRKVAGMSLLSAHVAFQHHERFDGTGYPRRLREGGINEYARIVAVADCYDNLTADRPGNPRVYPQQAVEYLIYNSGIYFDPDVVKNFIDNIALFPVGTPVLLNSGDRGLVSKVHKGFPTRPVVRIIRDREGRPVNPPFEIDLLDKHVYFLTGMLSEEEI